MSNRTDMLARFSSSRSIHQMKKEDVTKLATRNDVKVRKHAMNRYRERFNRDHFTDDYINKHLTQMLLDSQVASSKQKQIINNSASRAVRNNCMDTDEYEQYSFGDIILCVAFCDEMQRSKLVKVRHIITLYYEEH